jgi:GNAT superfamily N-acetyltransferase
VTAWHEAYCGLLPHEMIAALTVEVRQAWWAQVLSSPEPGTDETVYLAERGGTPVGFGVGNAQRAGALAAAGFDGEIRGPYVLRAAQGRGADRALIAATATGLQRAGYRAASAWMLRTNAPGRRFVEGLGGRLLDGPEAVRGHGRLTEVAYGWRDLAPLAAAGPGARAGGG